MTSPRPEATSQWRRRILSGFAILLAWAAMGGAVWTLDELAAPDPLGTIVGHRLQRAVPDGPIQ